VEAIALMNRQLSQQGVATKKLPLLHKAALAAARAAVPAQRIYQALNGAQWDEATALQRTGGSVADNSSSSSVGGFGHVTLAAGADAAYDAAAELVQQQQAELEEAVAAVLAAYSSSQGFGSSKAAALGLSVQQRQQGYASGAALLRAFVGDVQQGVVCLVVRPPLQQQQQQQQHVGVWVQQLLVPGHVLQKQEPLEGSELAAAAAGVTATAGAAGGRGRGRGRGGRGKGRSAAAAGDRAITSDEDGLLLLHVQVPDLACLAQELVQAQQQLAAAAAAAVGRDTAAFLGSYGIFKAMVAAAAELDVLAGFASVAGDVAAGSFCRPRFTAAGGAQAAAAAAAVSSHMHAGGVAAVGAGSFDESAVLQFEGLWHPLMGQSAAGGSSSSSVVPNDVQLGGDRPTAMLLTGEWSARCETGC
jgi:hypothetical protein